MISRSKLAHSLKRQPCKLIDGKHYIGLDTVLEKVRIAPSVNNSDTVHAYWIPCPGKSCIWHCSACGDRINYKQNRRTYNIPKVPVEQKNKFCRNCGACMGAKDIDVLANTGVSEVVDK